MLMKTFSVQQRKKTLIFYLYTHTHIQILPRLRFHKKHKEKKICRVLAKLIKNSQKNNKTHRKAGKEIIQRNLIFSQLFSFMKSVNIMLLMQVVISLFLGSPLCVAHIQIF